MPLNNMSSNHADAMNVVRHIGSVVRLTVTNTMGKAGACSSVDVVKHYAQSLMSFVTDQQVDNLLANTPWKVAK